MQKVAWGGVRGFNWRPAVAAAFCTRDGILESLRIDLASARQPSVGRWERNVFRDVVCESCGSSERQQISGVSRARSFAVRGGERQRAVRNVIDGG